MTEDIFEDLRAIRRAEQRALWDERWEYAGLLRHLYLMSMCHAHGRPINIGDF